MPLSGIILLVPTGHALVAVPLVLAGRALLGINTPIYSVNQIGLRQSLTRHELLRCVNASRYYLVFGMMPGGAALGSVVGLLIGAAGFFTAFLAIWQSPFRNAHIPGSAVGEDV